MFDVNRDDAQETRRIPRRSGQWPEVGKESGFRIQDSGFREEHIPTLNPES
jgi:hypothetical protein